MAKKSVTRKPKVSGTTKSRQRISPVKKSATKKKPARKSAPKRIADKLLRRKIGIALSNLILFAILFVISLVLYSVSNQEIYTNLFLMLSILFGFLAIAFLITYLIFFFLKSMGK